MLTGSPGRGSHPFPMNDEKHIIECLAAAQNELKRGVTASEVAKRSKFTRDFVRKTLTALSKTPKVRIEHDLYYRGKI